MFCPRQGLLLHGASERLWSVAILVQTASIPSCWDLGERTLNCRLLVPCSASGVGSRNLGPSPGNDGYTVAGQQGSRGQSDSQPARPQPLAKRHLLLVAKGHFPPGPGFPGTLGPPCRVAAFTRTQDGWGNKSGAPHGASIHGSAASSWLRRAGASAGSAWERG